MAGPTAAERTLYGIPLREALFTVMATMFVVVLVLTNIVGVKLFRLPGALGETFPPLTSGIITYPLTFLLTDLVAEIWGRKRASFMVWLGFGMSFLMLIVILIARTLPPSEIWANPTFGIESSEEMQKAFDASFSLPHVLLFASMTAYLVAQLFDVRLYHFWWRLTDGRHMWLRNNGSTMISQLVDTTIVNGIFLRLGLQMEWGQIAEIIAMVYVCKVLLAWIDTPLLYLGRDVLRNALGLEREAAPKGAPLA